MTLLLGSGLTLGGACSSQRGPSELDKELDAARKNAEKRKPAECYPGSDESCYTAANGEVGPEGTAGRGICKNGSRSCDPDGFWSSCEGAVLPTKELCNSIDDDCDGKVDNGFERAGAKCFAGEGECRVAGTYACSPDGSQSLCSAEAKAPQPEVCDNRDNDCDGEIDEGEMAGTGDSCRTGQLGACAAGTKQCVKGTIECVPNQVASVEICNKIDDDCDGKVDDDCISEEEARRAGVIK